MNAIINFLWNRANESSSWRGLVLILTALGVSLSPVQGEAIIAFGLAIAGIIGAFFPNRLASTRTRATDYPVAEPIDPFGRVQYPSYTIGPDAPPSSKPVPPVDYAYPRSDPVRSSARADSNHERWKQPYRSTPDERIAGYQPNDDANDDDKNNDDNGSGPTVPHAGGDR